MIAKLSRRDTAGEELEIVDENDRGLVALTCYQPNEVREFNGVQRAGNTEIRGDTAAIHVESSLEGLVLGMVCRRRVRDLGKGKLASAESCKALLQELMRGKLGGDIDYWVTVVRKLVGLLQGQGRLAPAGTGADGIIEPGMDSAEDVVKGLEPEEGDRLVTPKGAEVLIEPIGFENERVGGRALHYSFASSAKVLK